jgi:putative transposase
MIENGRHLFNCLCYVDLNMVRAGEVSHPNEWLWCGYNELIGKRKRYRIINLDRLLESLDMGGQKEFQANYANAIEQRTANNTREAHWTESLAVGSHDFTENCRKLYSRRSQLDIYKTSDTDTNTWTIKESPDSYNVI